jgi:hypothetical protein
MSATAYAIRVLTRRVMQSGAAKVGGAVFEQVKVSSHASLW